MARNPQFSLSYSLRDRSRENTGFSLWTLDPLDISGALPAEVTAFETQLALVADGTITSRRSLTSRKASNADIGAGQREDRFLITYEDTVTLAVYTSEIGTRKTSLLTVSGTDYFDKEIAPWSTFRTALQALAVSIDGNPINVLSFHVV